MELLDGMASLVEVVKARGFRHATGVLGTPNPARYPARSAR
jgi:hypothetical protein